jgi:hypothetical protein
MFAVQNKSTSSAHAAHLVDDVHYPRIGTGEYGYVMFKLSEGIFHYGTFKAPRCFSLRQIKFNQRSHAVLAPVHAFDVFVAAGGTKHRNFRLATFDFRLRAAFYN